MKNLLLSLLLILPLLGLAQESKIDSISKKITYSDVLDASGTKVQLFDKALEWFATSFKSSNDVIQIKDKDAGKIVGSYTVYISNGGPVTANIIVQVKDGKYKYTVTDFVFAGNGSFKPWALEEDPNPWKVGMMKKGIRYIKQNSFDNTVRLVSSLKTAMSKPAISDGF